MRNDRRARGSHELHSQIPGYATRPHQLPHLTTVLPSVRPMSFSHRDVSSAQWSGVHEIGATPETRPRTTGRATDDRGERLRHEGTLQRRPGMETCIGRGRCACCGVIADLLDHILRRPCTAASRSKSAKGWWFGDNSVINPYLLPQTTEQTVQINGVTYGQEDGHYICGRTTVAVLPFLKTASQCRYVGNSRPSLSVSLTQADVNNGGIVWHFVNGRADDNRRTEAAW